MSRSSILLLALFIFSQTATGKRVRGVSKDVPLISCELCPLVAEASFPAEGVATDEMAILDIVEGVCDPSSKHGRWMRSLDLVEKRNRLRVEKVNGVARCEVECRTVALACVDIVDTAGATDIADRVYAGTSPEELKQWLCGGQNGGSGGACKATSPPKIWKGRPNGPPFVPLPDKDVQMEDLMASLPKGMSMATRDSFGTNDDDDSEETAGEAPTADNKVQESGRERRHSRPSLVEKVSKAGSTMASRIRERLGGGPDGSVSTEL